MKKITFGTARPPRPDCSAPPEHRLSAPTKYLETLIFVFAGNTPRDTLPPLQFQPPRRDTGGGCRCVAAVLCIMAERRFCNVFRVEYLFVLTRLKIGEIGRENRPLFSRKMYSVAGESQAALWGITNVCSPPRRNFGYIGYRLATGSKHWFSNICYQCSICSQKI